MEWNSLAFHHLADGGIVFDQNVSRREGEREVEVSDLPSRPGGLIDREKRNLQDRFRCLDYHVNLGAIDVCHVAGMKGSFQIESELSPVFRDPAPAAFSEGVTFRHDLNRVGTFRGTAKRFANHNHG